MTSKIVILRLINHLNRIGRDMPTTSKLCPCKICQGAVRSIGSVDFNREVVISETSPFPPCGEAVEYLQCTSCGFAFTTHMDNFSNEDFSRRIYNDDYVLVDPEFAEGRPRSGANMLLQMFGPVRQQLSVLDYGSGSGVMPTLLMEGGFASAAGYDPFYSPQRPSGVYPLVTAFEVFEHTPTPHETLQDAMSFMAEESVLLFTTLVQPVPPMPDLRAWWYLGPRNGHISLHTRRSLEVLMEQHGLTLYSCNDNLHLACRSIPAFARSMLQG